MSTMKPIQTGMPVDQLSLATRKEHGTYLRKITEEDKATLATSVVDMAKREDTLAEERKATMEDLRERAKDLKTERKGLMKAITTGQIEEADMLHFFPDLEELRMRIYNSKGALVDDRRMTADEAQLRLDSNA